MKECMENKMTEEEQGRIANVAKGMADEEIEAFLSNIESRLLFNELIRRESETKEKMNKIEQLLNQFT